MYTLNNYIKDTSYSSPQLEPRFRTCWCYGSLVNYLNNKRIYIYRIVLFVVNGDGGKATLINGRKGMQASGDSFSYRKELLAIFQQYFYMCGK